MALNPSTNGTMAGRITAADANYPYGSSKDETSPGAGDGTPYFKARADDIFGFQQSLLDEASIVPSGNADNKGTSQYKEAIRTITNMTTVTHDMASDANYTLTDDQNRKRRVVITDTGVVLTTGRNIVVDDMEKRFIAVNETAQILTFIIAGTGVAVAAGATADLYNDGTDIVEAITAATTVATGVRQVVQSASVDANGLPDFISIGTGLAVDIAATSTPITIHSSNGAVANDRQGTILADTSISGLTDATTNYLYADVAADGTITLGSTILAPIYKFGGVYSTVAGQASFNISEMTMKVGDGGAANQTYRVFIGEAVTAGGVVTSVVNYALNGLAETAYTAAPATGAALSHNHYLGVEPSHFFYEFKLGGLNDGIPANNVIRINAQNNGTTEVQLIPTSDKKLVSSKLITGYGLGYRSLVDGTPKLITTQGTYRIIAQRGW